MFVIHNCPSNILTTHSSLKNAIPALMHSALMPHVMMRRHTNSSNDSTEATPNSQSDDFSFSSIQLVRETFLYPALTGCTIELIEWKLYVWKCRSDKLQRATRKVVEFGEITSTIIRSNLMRRSLDLHINPLSLPQFFLARLIQFEKETSSFRNNSA